MRTVISYLILIVFASTLLGCFGATIPGKPPSPFDDHDQLARLIGQKEEKVIEELGRPKQILSDGTTKYLMYWTTSSGANVLFMLWVPIAIRGDGEATLHCVRFELDLDNRVKVYGIESGSWQKLFDTYEVSSRCQSFFWSKNEITTLRGLPRRESNLEKTSKKTIPRDLERESKLKEQARNGDANAQFLLYEILYEFEPREALKWLCRSADQENSNAAFTLGVIHEFGKDIRRNYRYIILKRNYENYERAYVWYSRSIANGAWYDENSGDWYDESRLQDFVDRQLTPLGHERAKSVLESWLPGQCEHELVFIDGF